MGENLRERAEQIVRKHGSLACVGRFIPEAPFCDCAPNDAPLCQGCAEAALDIEAFARELHAEHAQERARLQATVAALILKWRADAAQEQRVSFCADELEQTLAETETKGSPT